MLVLVSRVVRELLSLILLAFQLRSKQEAEAMSGEDGGAATAKDASSSSSSSWRGDGIAQLDRSEALARVHGRFPSNNLTDSFMYTSGVPAVSPPLLSVPSSSLLTDAASVHGNGTSAHGPATGPDFPSPSSSRRSVGADTATSEQGGGPYATFPPPVPPIQVSSAGVGASDAASMWGGASTTTSASPMPPPPSASSRQVQPSE